MVSSKMSIKFLGTSSMPNSTRNYSSLLFKVDGYTVMVDCGESTQRQLQSRYVGGDDRMASIRTILITHLHADHVLGLVPLLMSMMGPTGNAFDPNQAPRVEIYGPVGLRALIRTTLSLCYANLSGRYIVHEFVWPTASEPHCLLNEPKRIIPDLPLHECEAPGGRDIHIDARSSSWPYFTSFQPSRDGAIVRISAAPISHRCPTLAYVFEEDRSAAPTPSEVVEALNRNGPALLAQRGIRHPLSLLSTLNTKRQTLELPDGTVLHPPALDQPGRKVTIMGDTNDGTGGFTPAQMNAGLGLPALAEYSDVLIHESTNIALPAHLNKNNKADSLEATAQRAASRGHSVPQTAGKFAALIKADKLILNHFSTRYPAPPHYLQNESSIPTNGRALSEPERKWEIMKEFERQAYQAYNEALGSDTEGFETFASYDGFQLDIPPRIRERGVSSFAKPWEKEKTIATNGAKVNDAQVWSVSPILLGQATETRHAMILLNSPIGDKQKHHFLRVWQSASVRICADGAANRLIDTFGFDAFSPNTAAVQVTLPDAILGDLDSIRPETQSFFESQGVKVHVRPSQYATDLQKCIQEIEDQEAKAGIEYTLVLYGGLAGRLDQSIHTLHVLWQLAPGAQDLGGVRDPKATTSDREGSLQKRRRTFAIGDGSVAWLLAPGKHRLHMDRRILGQTCGILPLGVGTTGAHVTTRGLKWNLDSDITTLGGFLSTSNHLASDVVEVETSEPVYWTVELRADDACDISNAI